jgi:hypothetical protein
MVDADPDDPLAQIGAAPGVAKADNSALPADEPKQGSKTK